MHFAERAMVEGGLGVTRTKVGAGDKEVAYAVRRRTIQGFLGGIVVTLIVLGVLVGIFAAFYGEERALRLTQFRDSMSKISTEKGDALRLGLAIHQQEAEREEQERDSVRMLGRISSVVNRKFDELSAGPSLSEETRQVLKNAKEGLVKYVNEELAGFQGDRKKYEDLARKRLDKLAAMQEQSMRDLLRSVSGIRLEALEDMLKDVFESAGKAPHIQASTDTIDELEDIADGLYEERLSLTEGKAAFEKLRTTITGNIPEALSTQLRQAEDHDTMASSLDELIEFARLAAGRIELSALEKKWEESSNAIQAREDRGEDVGDEATSATIEIVLAVHRLMSEGKVPIHLLDFDAIDLSNGDEGDDDDEDDQDADAAPEEEVGGAEAEQKETVTGAQVESGEEEKN